MTAQIPDPDPETVKAFNANVQAFNANVVAEFRANGGKVGGPFADAELLLLMTTGAKTGRPRVSPLGLLRIDGELIIVGSYRGADVHPSWVHNLRANPRAHVELGAESFDLTARELPSGERDAVWAKALALAPGFGDYQAKTSRVIPLFELKRL
jgi:deazaflavin-dependent oxidoreductase (nitroreductase family)